jgi:TrmH family RNA methyltransferase
MKHRLENMRVVLVATRNPLNIGAVARAMSNFGAPHLRVVNPYEPSFREAKSAVGAAALLAKAQEFPTVAQAVADCTLVVGTTAIGNREIKQPLRDLQDAGPLIHKRMAAGKVALLFGSEKRGLSNEDLSYCHWLVHIPTREEHRSMNLGQAVAVCLYEIAREEGEARTTKVKVQEEKFAPMETVERITAELLEVLRASEYVAPRGNALAEEKLRRMMRRFALEAADAEVFLGMVKKIAWKLNRG